MKQGQCILLLESEKEREVDADCENHQSGGEAERPLFQQAQAS